MTQTIGILGAGAWGTALAQTAAVASSESQQVLLWARSSDLVTQINTTRENEKYLKGVKLDPAITAITDLKILAKADVILLCVPAQHLLSYMMQIIDHVPRTTPLVICSKGILTDTTQLLTTALEPYTKGHALGVLSGPSFAKELAEGCPTAVTIAFPKEHSKAAQTVTTALACGHFRLYQSNDVIGVQIGGAVKNVLAIACGIVAGREMGDNARAAVITRGLAEMRRLGAAMSALDETFVGLSGIGDLVLTCNAMQSRNFSFGYALGQGQSVAEILQNRHTVTEGVATATAVIKLAEQHGVEMPICHSVFTVLSGANTLEPTIRNLLARPGGSVG